MSVRVLMLRLRSSAGVVHHVGDGLEPLVAHVFAGRDEPGRCENQESPFAPCQCLVPGGHANGGAGGEADRLGSLSAWTSQTRRCRSVPGRRPPFVPWWMCQLLRQAGSKVMLFTGTLPSMTGALKLCP